MDSLYNELMAGANFAEMAKKISEDTGSGKKGGDLGWFGEGKMVQPFWEAVLKLEDINDISEPVETQFGWHILKLTGKREAEPGDVGDEPAMEYKASHILLKVFASPSTLAAIEERANGFVQDAVVYGFEESAEDFQMDIIKIEPFSKSGFIPKLGNVPAISDFAFDAKAGDISDVILARNSLIVCQLDKRIPPGYSPLEEVRDRVEQALLSQKQIEEAQKHAAGLRQDIEDGKSFEDMAASDGKQIEETDYFARYEFVPKIGSDPKFIGAAFSLSDDNPISKGVESRAGSYILKYVDRQTADTTLLAAQQDSLLQSTQDKERREIWSRWINSAKQNAEIEDYRSFYYGG
jgi:parvulin-like peptidyl-prolyl isomerase